MAGFKLQGKNEAGQVIDIPLAATYDSAGNEIQSYYASKLETLPVVETTETNANNLPKGVGVYVNTSGFTDSKVAGFTPYIIEQTVSTTNTNTIKAIKQTTMICQANLIYVYSRVGYSLTEASATTFYSWVKLQDGGGTTATTAITATKIGTSTIGSEIQPIYLSLGTPTASTSTVGEPKIPVYLKEGELTAAADVLNIDDMFNTTMTSVQIGAGADATQNYGVVIGNDATSISTYSTVIGDEASANGTADATAIGAGSTSTSYGTAVGKSASVSADYGVAIGRGAKISSDGTNSAQIGSGTNNTPNSLQFRSYRVPCVTQSNLSSTTTYAYAPGTAHGAGTTAPSGYIIFDNGLKMEWGLGFTTGKTRKTVALQHVSFTNKKYIVLTSCIATDNGMTYNYGLATEPLDGNNFYAIYGSDSDIYFRYFAIGY